MNEDLFMGAPIKPCPSFLILLSLARLKPCPYYKAGESCAFPGAQRRGTRGTHFCGERGFQFGAERRDSVDANARRARSSPAMQPLVVVADSYGCAEEVA